MLLTNKTKTLLPLTLVCVITHLCAQGQIAGVCTSPASYGFDESVTWYFDLTGNGSASAGEDLYFWSWEPVTLPGGPAQLTYVKDMTWSLSFVPSKLYGVTAQELTDAGADAFWGAIQNASGGAVSGTIPFAQKEELRKGTQCHCIGTPSESDNAFLINLGSSEVASPATSGSHWTNVSSVGAVDALVDSSGVHRYDISTSGDFLPNNNSDFLTPQESLLGALAVTEATESYLYLAAGGKGTVTISCLDVERTYKLSILGSRNSTSARSTTYEVAGLGTQMGTVQTSGSGIATDTQLNTNDDELYVAEVYPDINGEIIITVTVESGDFGYLNAIRIDENDEPVTYPIESMSIDPGISATGPSQLTITYVPDTTTQDAVTWSVDDQTVAIIDQEGHLKPKTSGTVWVKAVNAFDPSVADSVQVTFVDLTTSFQLALNHPTLFVAPQDMRRVYDKDSTVTNLFEMYTSLDTGATVNFIGPDGDIIGGGNGTLSADSGAITAPDGWQYVLIDLNDSTYSFEALQGFKVVSHMIPTTASQTGWWGGDQDLDTYEGNGVWSATIDFSEKPDGNDVRRMYFSQIGTNRLIKHVDDTKNQVEFTDTPGADTKDLYHFNGEYKVYLDMQHFTFRFEKECETVDDHHITFLGSSVCLGYGAELSKEPWLLNGYATQFKHQSEDRFAAGKGLEWSFSNVSIGGNNTIDVQRRLDRNLYTQCGKYVMIGLSMANEGLFSGKQATFDQFETNMLALIDTLRNHGKVPVVVSNYGNNGYTAELYDFIKDMNLLIAQWDVPSVNVLGALDDGNGRFISGYYLDGGHPNTTGYTEFFSAIVPSMFDAMAADKPLPELQQGQFLTVDGNTQGPFSIVPEEQARSFTLTFDFKTSGSGTLASIVNGAASAVIELDADGHLNYNGTILGTISSNDDQWHQVSLTHYHARGTTELYLDGSLIGSTDEQNLINAVVINDDTNAPASVDYSNLLFHRSGMHTGEIAALYSGAMLKASLEIYAPLDGTAQNPLENMATSTNELIEGVTTSINDRNWATLLTFFPTQISTTATVEIGNQSSLPYQVLTSSGQQIASGVLNDPQTTLDFTTLASGMYLFQTPAQAVKFIKH